MSDIDNKVTREEWRQLGYHYDKDDTNKKWIITGSPFGIITFVHSLLDYASDPNNELISEHDHLGPYHYLEIMTWDKPGMDGHSIHGTLKDLKRLAELIKSKVDQTMINKRVIIREEYAYDSDYSLELVVKEFGYDPALSDEQLW